VGWAEGIGLLDGHVHWHHLANTAYSQITLGNLVIVYSCCIHTVTCYCFHHI